MKIQNEEFEICVTVHSSKRIRKLNQHFPEDKLEILKTSNKYSIKNSNSNKSIKSVIKSTVKISPWTLFYGFIHTSCINLFVIS